MMKRRSSWGLGHRIRAMVALVALPGFAWALVSDLGTEPVGATSSKHKIANNHPASNPGGPLNAGVSLICADGPSEPCRLRLW